MNSTARWQKTETLVPYYRGSSWRIIEDQCRVYGLRWLRRKTCYTEPLRRYWASSPKILPDISHYNKTYAAQICEKINATLPYSELIFVLRKSLESIVFSAQEHIEFIHDKYKLHSDKGYWFGVTFDEYVGKYIVDTTKQPFEMISYPFIANVSQTKQVRITFIRGGPCDVIVTCHCHMMACAFDFDTKRFIIDLVCKYRSKIRGNLEVRSSLCLLW